MTLGPALTAEEADTVRAILRAILPPDSQVYVFGSRATGECKPWSDLDLVIETPQALPLPLIARLREAFEESDLAWTVDLVDRRAVSEEFGRIIDASKVPLALRGARD